MSNSLSNFYQLTGEVERAARDGILPANRFVAMQMSLEVLHARAACRGKTSDPGLLRLLKSVRDAALDLLRVPRGHDHKMGKCIDRLNEARELLWDALPREETQADEKVAGEGRNTKQRKETKGKHIDARILKLLSDRPESVSWSGQQIADALGCGKSTVMESATWKNTIGPVRQQARLRKQLDKLKRPSKRRKPRHYHKD
jgi:hypothetical protein